MISLVVVNQNTQLYSYINIDKFQSVGSNINFSITHKFFDWQIGSAYTGRYNSLSETNNAPKFSWSPELSSSFSINIPKINTSIAGFYKFNGAIPGYASDGNGGLLQTTIQPYSMLDISATVRIWQERFIVSAGAKNILNVKNINYNVSNSTAHNLSSNTMSMGMGITGFASLKINLTHNFSKKNEPIYNYTLAQLFCKRNYFYTYSPSVKFLFKERTLVEIASTRKRNRNPNRHGRNL